MKTLFKSVLAAAVLAAAGYGAYVYMQPENDVSYITEPVKRGRISQTVSATGEISASHLVEVGAQVSGQVRRMHVKIGDVVQKGDLIAEIDNTSQTNELNTNKARLQTYQAQLESAQIALRSAQRKYGRYQALSGADAVSKEEFDSAADNLAAAKARIKELQSSIRQTQIAIHSSEADLGYTRITAPITGTVVALVVEEGQTVNANQTAPTIVQIADLSKMLNKMQIAEGDATKVKAGQEVKFTILSEPDTPIAARLDSIDPGLTTMSQGAYSKSTDTTSSAIYYYARATVPNPDGKLAIGMTTQNTIEIASTGEVLTVPSMAVKSRDGKQFVRVLGADGKGAADREVQTGLKDGMNTEIRAGLNEGEQIVMNEMSSAEEAEKLERDARRMQGPPR